MAARFLGKTPLAGLVSLRANTRPVLEQYEHFRSALAARVGVAAAELFAEPMITWDTPNTPGSISWYAEAIGEAEPLQSVGADRRQRLEAAFTSLLAALAPLLSDQDLGPLLLGALVVASRDGIRVIDDRVVLTDWGLYPAGVNMADNPRARLAQSPVGAFMTLPVADAGVQPASPGPTPQPRRVVSPPGFSKVAPVQAPVAARGVAGARNWWLMPAALCVSVLFLLLGLWLGVRIVAERVAARPGVVALFDEDAVRQSIDRQKQENDALEHEVEARRRALEGNVCLADPAQMPRLGPDQDAPVPPAAIPAPPGRTAFQGSLADLLKQAAVFVIAPAPQGTVTGSGFFVTPDMILTNRHVVEKGDPEKIFVTNAKLGRLTPAHIVAMTPSSTIGSLDVALLKLDEPAPVQPLSVTTTVVELDPVIAAGYPSVTIGVDESYQRLLHGGDETAVPPVILTDGKISAIQETPAGIKVMPHTANISGGNSGGPLVDACGRVVGINTFINVNAEQAASAKWAEKIDAVLVFLAGKGTVLTPLTEPCNPAAPASGPPAATAPVPNNAPPGDAGPAPRGSPAPAPAPSPAH